jgi:acyl-CoA thioester hydrolase
VIAWDLPDPFLFDVRVHDDEVDGLGHTNNAVYLQFCERCAWAHADAVGTSWDEWRELDRAMAVLRSEMKYLAPSYGGEELRVANWLVTMDGRLRATRRFQIVRPRDELTLLRGDIDYVCIEISSGKPRRMPPEFLRAYGVLDSVRETLAAGTG